MRRSVYEMSREELVKELPLRMLVMMVFLASTFAAAIMLSFTVIQTQLSLPWTVTLLIVVLSAPVGISRMFTWTIAPARERIRRKKSMMREALASVTWSGGDYEV